MNCDESKPKRFPRIEFTSNEDDDQLIRDAAWVARKSTATFVRELALSAAKTIMALPGKSLEEKREAYFRLTQYPTANGNAQQPPNKRNN